LPIILNKESDKERKMKIKEIASGEIGNAIIDKNWGTFADNLKAPVHRWFKYPAGYSYKFVDNIIAEYSLDEESWVLDPFVGCGTTSVEAKRLGVNSIGIELHPFVYRVALAKTFWEFNISELKKVVTDFIEDLRTEIKKTRLSSIDLSNFPELLHKCYSYENLARLKIIREHIIKKISDERTRDLLNLCLTDCLRSASRAGTGWPYIAPTKYQEKYEKDAFIMFQKTTYRMVEDLTRILYTKSRKRIETILIEGDAREPQEINHGRIDIAITSPPYLNNFDYADRTRLELYFFNHASTWGDISRNIRNKLMMAATTQVNRSDFDQKRPLSEFIKAISKPVYDELNEKIKELGRIRLKKGGKKSYDYMVAGYFNDMGKVLFQVYKYLKKGGRFILVLGDSAPYGVHIPTERYLGMLALGLGYWDSEIRVLRTRGKKWRNNPQRHKVLLKESILMLSK
jgi:DNA modification methylase